MPAAAGQTLSVMVVEDSRATADILGMFFESEGHRVRVVYDGEEAVKQAITDFPDLILMDLGLPMMSGLEATSAIRQQQSTKRSIVVALTGFDDAEMLHRCSDSGFDAHIAKPADPAELQQLVSLLFPTGTGA
ncbi:MAG: response regulator [Luteolibacter sp.]